MIALLAAFAALATPMTTANDTSATRPHLPAADNRRANPPVDLNTPRTFPTISSLEQWRARRADIRRRLLTSFGLYPLPPRTPLNSHVFGRVERDGYSIENAYFESYPGFYVCGNLYRPLGKPLLTDHKLHAGRHPAVLIAHGHWQVGRMADTELGSIPARAITFARMGFVAFTYDMVGYNDARQIDHGFAGDARHWLWGISLMGLQTWDSIRALDFLESLPDVDPKRLAITGESGGGTQTMMLGAVDDRLAAVGPCVMVSHTMQGGCLCENAPGLRADCSNMEIAAAAAPTPQIMVGAAGDWTKSMMSVEGPAVASVYRLYGRPDRLSYVIYPYPHNVNKTSREAVYRFFAHWLLADPDVSAFTEPPYHMEPVADLRVFPDNTPLPAGAVDADTLTRRLIDSAANSFGNALPADRADMARFKQDWLPLWQETLALELPHSGALLSAEAGRRAGDAAWSAVSSDIGRAGAGDRVATTLFTRPGHTPDTVVIIADAQGRSALMDARTGSPASLVSRLLDSGLGVLLVDTFGSGATATEASVDGQPFDGSYFCTYNRTDAQLRVQDLVTACAYARHVAGAHRVLLLGIGRAGLDALLAAPAADGVAADCCHLDLTSDAALLTKERFVPCLRRLGDFAGAAALAAPHPLLLFDTGDRFSAATALRALYGRLGASAALDVHAGAALDDAALAAWVSATASRSANHTH